MTLPRDWNQGGSDLIPGTGRPNLRDLLSAFHGVPDLSTLSAIPATERSDGMLARVVTGGDWRWSDASALAPSGTGDNILVVGANDAPALGAWIRSDEILDVKLPVAFGTADAAVLWTVPAGFVLAVMVPWWEVTVSFTGGSSSAIGISSSNAGLSTNGDLLGGASGDVLATLVSTGAKAKGTKGTKIGTPAAVLFGGDTVKFNRITSAFTAGSGFVHLPVAVLTEPVS